MIVRLLLAATVVSLVLAAFLSFFFAFLLAPLAIIGIFYVLYVLRETLIRRHESRVEERTHREADARRREIERGRVVRLGARR